MGQVVGVGRWGWGALLALMVGVGAQAAAEDTGLPAGARDITLSEAQLLQVALVLNQDEVAQGQLALQRATDAEVRAFAARMVDEHGQAVQRLQALALRLGLQPTPSPLSEKLQAGSLRMLARLEQLPAGFHFDFGYMAAQVLAHAHTALILDRVLWYQAQSPLLLEELRLERRVVQEHKVLAHAIARRLWVEHPQQPPPPQEPR